MKAILTTLCGCSQMVDVDEPLPMHYRVPMRSPCSVQLTPLGVHGTENNYRVFSFDTIEKVNGQKIVMYVERWGV